MPPHPLEIRVATPADIPAIVALNDALFQEDSGQRDPFVDVDWAKQHGVEYFTPRIAGERCTCFVATAEEVVGYLAGYIYGPNDLRPVVSAELESIFVRPQWRDRLVGMRLVDTFLAWASLQGARRVSVTAHAATCGRSRSIGAPALPPTIDIDVRNP